VLSFGPPGPYSERLRAHGIEVVDLGLRRPLRQNSIGALWAALRTLVRVVVRGRWDVVHTHMFLSSVVVTPLARVGRARAMGTTHRIYYGRVQPIVERAVSVLQERIVVDSEAVGEILRSHTHIRRDKYVVIYNGIDVAEFAGRPTQVEARAVLGLPPDAFVVGEIAHLAPHKGQIHLVRAAAQVRAEVSGLQVLLVGDGPDREALEAEVARLGLGETVHLLGARSDLPALLSAIDVLALPSTFEGFGIVQAEAMYLERPVVATSHGGSTEVVDDGVTGYLLPFGDVDGIGAHLVRLAQDRELRARMGTAGRRRVEERFTSQQMGAAYLALYG
jgi:glycosyltransferase involved in cell wall biosynthesis